MVDGILRVLPDASVGHLGLYRDEATLRPVTYYSRLPTNVDEATVLLLDPMLATGQSAAAAVSILKSHGAHSITFVCVVACPAGIAHLKQTHPEVPIVTAAIDPNLTTSATSCRGLGDAGRPLLRHAIIPVS
jgi:uracil phosphoribosyltransferase